MADDPQSSTGNLHVEPATPPEPPPGSVSEFRLDDTAIQGARDHVRAALPNLPALREVPTWVFLAGAVASGAVAYAAYRVLKATAPVLVPAALGLPPGTAQVFQQLAARRPSAFGPQDGAPVTQPMTQPMTQAMTQLMARPASSALQGMPATIPGVPLGADIPSGDLATILSLVPSLGRASATASALETVATNLRHASTAPQTRAPVSSSSATTRPATTRPATTRPRAPWPIAPREVIDDGDDESIASTLPLPRSRIPTPPVSPTLVSRTSTLVSRT